MSVETLFALPLLGDSADRLQRAGCRRDTIRELLGDID
jgi:hypothetical protein